jgi:hypothetical protein
MMRPHHVTPAPWGPPLTANSGGGFLFLGIGFAIIKQLVGVDIGFTPLSFGNPHRSLAIG